MLGGMTIHNNRPVLDIKKGRILQIFHNPGHRTAATLRDMDE